VAELRIGWKSDIELPRRVFENPAAGGGDFFEKVLFETSNGHTTILDFNMN
jgi:hypothetical protein